MEQPGRGYGRAHGAVSIVNAIGTGFGVAVGVGLRVEARLWRCGEYMVESLTRGLRLQVDPAIVEAVAEVAGGEAGSRLQGLCGTVVSEVPLEAGLKGSSALVNAMLQAALEILGVDPRSLGLLRLARLGVEAARRAGLTITGALDDHLATLGSGVFYTRNPDQLLLHASPQSLCGKTAVIGVSGRRSIRSVDPAEFRKRARLFMEAFLLAYHAAGDEAMLRAAALTNSVAVLDSLGGSISPLVAALSAGATVAGVTGKGPAYYAVASGDVVDEVEEALRRSLPEGAEVLRAPVLACGSQELGEREKS